MSEGKSNESELELDPAGETGEEDTELEQEPDSFEKMEALTEKRDKGEIGEKEYLEGRVLLAVERLKEKIPTFTTEIGRGVIEGATASIEAEIKKLMALEAEK